MRPAPRRKQVLLYFGSFNPIHTGHLALAEYALAHTPTDELWFVLSPQNPLKQDSGLWDDKFRLQLARIAAEPRGMQVSDIEFSLPRPNYTYRTLQALSARYPGIEFSMLIGADNYNLFSRWRNHCEILARYRIYVYPRAGIDADRTQFPQMTWLDAPLLPISSTQIREKLAAHEPITGMVTDEVEKILVRAKH